LRKGRYNKLGSSVFVVGLILSALFLLNPRDLILQILGFVALQMIMGLTSVLLILMRLAYLIKNKGAWFYYFSGTFQVFLLIADLILLFTSQTVTKKSMLVFICLNSLFASIIFMDIYKTKYAK
jgi:hypothetical protein